MIVHAQKSNANTFVCVRAYRVFLTLCVRINLGDIPQGLQHPRDVPSVDPSTLGRKTLYELASLKYCYNTSLGNLGLASKEKRTSIQEAVFVVMYTWVV